MAYLICWAMAVVASCAASIGLALGHELIGAIVSGTAAIIAICIGIYEVRRD